MLIVHAAPRARLLNAFLSVGRPRKEQTMQVVSLRLPDALVRRVDQLAARLQEDTPLLEVTRTDALRYLILVGLQASEKERSPRTGKREL